MRRFHFQLEKVLTLRANREKETELALGRALGMLAGIENALARAAEEKVSAAARRFAPGHGAAEILNYDRYIFRLDVLRDELLVEAAKAQLAVEEARNEYIEASRERKVLEKLKERREQKYRKEAFAEEVMMLDDISGGRSARIIL